MFWSAVLSVCIYSSIAASQQCPYNSVYSECGCMLTCEMPYPTQECIENCEPGCICSPGYLLRSDGQCVPHTMCSRQEDMQPPSPPDTNVQYQCVQDEQYYDCTPSCKNTCENYNNAGAQCGCGQPGCFCREGLVKRKDGKCVPPQECQAAAAAPQECPPDSVYIECGSECAPTCAEPKVRPCGSDKCVPGCFCKPGYLLNKEGTGCVQPQHCDLKEKPKPSPPKCPDHSVFIRCGSACAPTCSNPYPEPCGDDCLTACFCYPGYLMDRNGTNCVRPDQCEIAPKPAVTYRDYKDKCQENSVYQECGTSCPKTCENPNPQLCTLQCVAGCFCKPGYLKRKDGKCVLQEQCDIQSRCGEDEQYYECPPSCKNTCRHYNDPGVRCRCGPPGCFCKEGLVKNEEGKCVRTNQCPITPPKCVANAVFVPCGSQCPPTCDDPRPAPCSQTCVAGCFCKPGFLQNKEGKCVKQEQCMTINETRCGENAEYSECGPACPETCQNTQPRQPCIAACLPGCFCKPGFVRNDYRKCVSTNLCENKCSLPEEEYRDCGSNCPATCDNISLPPARCPYKCVRGCFCKRGLVRDLKGACVTPKDCSYLKTTPVYTTETATTSTPLVTVIDISRGCPDQKLCEAFCKSHKLNFGYCEGTSKTECRCA